MTDNNQKQEIQEKEKEEINENTENKEENKENKEEIKEIKEIKEDKDEDQFDDDENSDDSEDESEQKGPLKRHINIVFIGHVDAGKSTIGGQIMYATGRLSKRVLEKNEHEAKQKNRESWAFAWAFDLTDYEREKGKTEEVGTGYFETEHKKVTILDAPGHKAFVPHMIGGASQADIAVLVISARKGEFETGFEKGGQTREHALLVKTAGVKRIIVAINKMDEPTVKFSEKRYNECLSKLTPFLKQVGYAKTSVHFLPVSGIKGYNIKDRFPEGFCTWYTGPTLLEYIDQIQPPEQLFQLPFRMSIIDRYREKGTVIHGKIESGTVSKGDILLLMPPKIPVEILTISIESTRIHKAEPGDNVKMRLRGVNEEDISVGFVICDYENPVSVAQSFLAQTIILDHKSIISPGYKCVMHIHSLVIECAFGKLLATVDKKTQKVIQKKPQFIRTGDSAVVRLFLPNPISVETYKSFPQFGRFMLRDEGKTIAVGVITKLFPLKN